MSIFFLILGVASADVNPAMQLIKIPISQGVKKITCQQAYDKNTKFVENPNYEEGNGEVWGYYVYEGKPIFLHYCKDKNGDWVK